MKKLLVFAVMIITLAGISFAQDSAKETAKTDNAAETKPLSFYKIEYVLRELQDGKAINTRTYVMTVEDHQWGEAKVGARVPVSTSMSPTGPSTFQYMDIGINIRCKPSGMNEFTSLQTSVEISSFALPEEKTTGQPVVRQMKTDMAAAVPNGKQTVIGVIDDVNSTKRYEIAVTATKLK